MLSEILSQLNWVDFFIIIVMIRIIYVSAKTGFVVEFFKLLGVILAIYCSCHYYISAADIFKQYFSSIEKYIPLEFFDLLVFIFVFFVSYVVSAVIRGVICHFISMQAVPLLSRWGAVILGVVRGVMIAGVIIFILAISTIKYLNKSAQESYSGQRLWNVTAETYSFIWNNFMSRFMPNEKYNEQVNQVKAEIDK